MQNKYFDSCLYPKQSNIKEIKNLFKINKKKYKALVHITSDKNLTKFKYVINKNNKFYPLLHITKNEEISKQLKKIKHNNIKNIKLHPRFLNKKITKILISIKKSFLIVKKIK